MLLAIDAGNSNIVMGIFQDNSWRHHWRVETDYLRERTVFDEQISEQWHQLEISAAIVSSVVPSLTDYILKEVEKATAIKPTLLRGAAQTGITLKTQNPDEVGTDIIANAVAAYHHFRESCLIVDFGTATTVMAVQEPGILSGGAISAGLQTSMEALTGNAEQLPGLSLQIPDKAMGTSTTSAMQSGLVLGHIAMVEGLVRRMKEESGAQKVMATGGLSAALAPHTEIFSAVDPLLTLNGLRIIEASRKRGNRDA